MSQMIPANIDTVHILRDLNEWGWRDYKIEMACGFSKGYIAQVRCRNVKEMTYARAARLYNFWLAESETQLASCVTLGIQPLEETTS
jgi:hypothetical protein